VVELQRTSPGAGRTAGGTLTGRISTRGVLPPVVAAATLLAVLAAGVVVYKKRQLNSSDRPPVKQLNFHNTDEGTMTDEWTESLDTISEKKGSNLYSGDPSLEQETHNNSLSQIAEEARDPDLSGWSEFFESVDSNDGEKEEEYSIEDFVNEAERSLLGVRIRYPTEPTKPSRKKSSKANSREKEEADISLDGANCTALVPVSETAGAIVPHAGPP
jgi:hypothetical protein